LSTGKPKNPIESYAEAYDAALALMVDSQNSGFLQDPAAVLEFKTDLFNHEPTHRRAFLDGSGKQEKASFRLLNLLRDADAQTRAEIRVVLEQNYPHLELFPALPPEKNPVRIVQEAINHNPIWAAKIRGVPADHVIEENDPDKLAAIRDALLDLGFPKKYIETSKTTICIKHEASRALETVTRAAMIDEDGRPLQVVPHYGDRGLTMDDVRAEIQSKLPAEFNPANAIKFALDPDAGNDPALGEVRTATVEFPYGVALIVLDSNMKATVQVVDNKGKGVPIAKFHGNKEGAIPAVDIRDIPPILEAIAVKLGTPENGLPVLPLDPSGFNTAKVLKFTPHPDANTDRRMRGCRVATVDFPDAVASIVLDRLGAARIQVTDIDGKPVPITKIKGADEGVIPAVNVRNVPRVLQAIGEQLGMPADGLPLLPRSVPARPGAGSAQGGSATSPGNAGSGPPASGSAR